MRNLLVAAILAGTLPEWASSQVSAVPRTPSGVGAAPTIEQFVAEARQATERYQRPEAAAADGFKRVGAEFPAMGEHWVSVGRIMEDTLVPARPAVLIYVTVRGRRQLAGVGYTALLDPGEQPPAWAPARGYWHEHNGSVAEESLPAMHGRGHHGQGAGHAADPLLRLAIMHAWVWTENPAGVFATDNWALPPLRVGAPASPRPRDVVREMALASDEEGYYEQTIATRLGSTAADQERAARIVEDHRLRARDALGTGTASGAGGEVWRAMWLALADALPDRAAELRALEAEL